MTHAWAIPVHLLPDELFSTWLARAALAQGCDPIHLTGALWPKWRAWTVDLDRGLTDERLKILSARSGLTEARLEAATLKPMLNVVAPDVKQGQTTWPWVLAQGSRNRRRQGGLQFCPKCLDEDSKPYFRRSWRFAWHVGCERHGTLLADCCGSCSGPIEPHRARATDKTLCKCPSCGNDLRNTPTATVSVDAIAFQAIADAVLETGHGTWANSVVNREIWFRLAAKSARGHVYDLAADSEVIGITSLALNMQRPIERAFRMRMAFESMKGASHRQPRYLPRNLTAPPGKIAANSEPIPAPARPQVKVQGDWIRFLRRLRVGCP